MSSADENREMFKILQNINNCFQETYTLKGIVSRDFRCLQMILTDRIGFPDVPLKVYSLFIYFFILFFKFKVFSGLSFY